MVYPTPTQIHNIRFNLKKKTFKLFSYLEVYFASFRLLFLTSKLAIATLGNFNDRKFYFIFTLLTSSFETFLTYSDSNFLKVPGEKLIAK